MELQALTARFASTNIILHQLLSSNHLQAKIQVLKEVWRLTIISQVRTKKKLSAITTYSQKTTNPLMLSSGA